MKLLITGATGFIGKHVLAQFDIQDAEVAIFVRDAARFDSKKYPNVSVIEGSLDGFEEYKNRIKEFDPDTCLHLAWEGIPDYSAQISTKNLNHSLTLIDFLLDETKCQKIVVGGSCFEYGSATGRVDEKCPEESPMAFTWAKNSLKTYLALRASEKKAIWAWMRIFYVFGPGQREKALIPSLVAAFRNNLPSPIKNPNNANDFVYVEDVARALKMACLDKIDSGIYNLGSGTLFKVSDVWHLVKNGVIAKDSLNPAIGCYANIEKIKQKLQWAPDKSVEERMRQFIAHLNEKGAQ